jgi:hypothetical protein
MQLIIQVGAASLSALLDSGSKHNFIDVNVARRAGVHLQGCDGLRNAVANGDRLICPDSCSDMQIIINSKVFGIDCYGLSLGSCDMVLGVQWLESLGPILWDFARRTMGFVHNGHRIFWTAATLTPELSAITSASSDLFEELLLQFAPIFEEPTGLPPEGERSHRICLLPGTPPVVVRLYRYTHFQKQELERQCVNILCTGIIRPNSSTFSAPVLLVKKSD